MEFAVYKVEDGSILTEKGTGTFRGEGNFCGWYTVEYLDKVRILGEYNSNGSIEVCDKVETVEIKSIYTEIKFEAKNVDVAREKFKQMCEEEIRTEQNRKTEEVKKRKKEFDKLWKFLAKNDLAPNGVCQLPRLQFLLKEYYGLNSN